MATKLMNSDMFALLVQAYMNATHRGSLALGLKSDAMLYRNQVLLTYDAALARVTELEAALGALYDETKDTEDLGSDDGDGHFDTWQSDELGRVVEKARLVLGQERRHVYGTDDDDAT